jgi:RNA polymerase sigma-70 factor (ECF subfamily)
MNDTDALIDRCLNSDQLAYAQLYEQYATGLYRLCYSLLLHEQDAEDVSQEAFVYAFKNLHRYDKEKASFKTWLYTIAVSRCRNMYRRKQFAVVDLSQVLHLDLPTLAFENPEASLSRRNAEEAIAEALTRLSPNLREAIVLRYGQGLTYREIAEVMDCPQKTAESRVRLAHERLHGILKPVGIGLLHELLQAT